MTGSRDERTGSEIRAELLGEKLLKHRDESIYNNDIMKDFVEITNVTIFEKIWARPGIDLKTRALITMISDVATGRLPELETHIEICLRQGWSEAEVKEAILHLLAYVGAPLVRSSLLVAVKVFDRVAPKAVGS